MEEPHYNNRQIERMLDDAQNDIKEHITLHIDPLTKQVTKTNGKVRWQEKMIYLAVGALTIIIPIFVWVLKDYLSFKDSFRTEIHAAIEEALEDYEPYIVE